jgi:hypothetical protein
MKSVVLLSMLTMSVATWGQSLNLPPNYVATPIGWIHQSCLYEVAENESVEEPGIIHRADGSVFTPPPCPYATVHPVSSDPSAEFPTFTNWTTDGTRANANGFTFLSGQWTVPLRPDNTGATIFIFPGIQDPQNNFIIQPVLQFGSSMAGGGNFWAIASFACPFGGNCFINRGGAQRVDVGNTIVGSLVGSHCGGGCTWVITAESSNGSRTQITWQARQVYPFAFVAFEVAGLSHCNQLPEDTSLKMSTALENSVGAVVTGPWHPETLFPHCNFHTTSSDGSSATLHWQF